MLVSNGSDTWSNLAGDLRYCSYCGNEYARSAAGSHERTLRCVQCGREPVTSGAGPALLVLVALFADDRVLLQRRGVPPYAGCWAPPGGFVEAGESLEEAAVREVWEEVRVKLDPRQLTPSALISLPPINQVHCGFVARLPTLVEVTAVPPETLEVGWFTEAEMRRMENWDPAARIDIGVQFAFYRSRAFEFIQQTDGFLRLIDSDGVRYL
jgi:ADP-ribose pyrophosphatase YjhB (NUDIX family)